MSFILTIRTAEKDMAQILETGFIHCDISTCSHPERILRYVYCVHCRHLRARSWMYTHAEKNPFVLTARLEHLLTHSMHLFESDIRTEAELIWDSGKLFARSFVEDDSGAFFDPAVSSTSTTSTPPQPTPVSDSHCFLSDVREVFFNDEENGREPPDTVAEERTFRCVQEFILKQCFLRKRFDSARFLELMGRLSCFDSVRHVLSEKRDSFLPLLIGSVMRKVFVSLSLTRSQIDTVSKLFKCVLLLVSEDNSTIAQRIHSNYDSCLQEAWTAGEEKDVFVEDSFQKCECYSLALDTALFGQEHIMSCTVRFVFENDVTQFPLFMALCYASSGEETASFLLSKLREKKAVFSKLVSLTIDGASNMIGNERGLFACFCHLLKRTDTLEKDRISRIKNVWCFAHRMNLVTRDLREVPNMNEVFTLADWVTSRRVAVCYRKFLKTKYRETRFPKIPTPSETRWLFYRDVVKVIISQYDQIVLFINESKELCPTCLTLSQGMCSAVKMSVLIQKDGFKTNLLIAKFILDVLGEENARMQAKNALFTELWDRVCRLRAKMAKCIASIKDDDFSSIGVTSLSPAEKEAFVTSINVAIKNLQVRFPCASTSLNKRRLGDAIKMVDACVDRGILVRAQLSCNLRLLNDVYMFPGEFLRNTTVKQYLLSELDGEVNRLCARLFMMQKELRKIFKIDAVESNDNIHHPDTHITLAGIFRYVDHSEFPLLWKSVFEVLCINPTTVTCEQSFSCLKHSNHVNTKIDNLCKLVDCRLSILSQTREQKSGRSQSRGENEEAEQ